MIKTAGGRFDPTKRPIYFAAGEPGWGTDPTGNTYPHNVLVAVNEMMDADSENVRLVPHLRAGRTVLLDSGIFWLTNQHMKTTGCTMDQALSLAPEEINGFDQLFERYVYLTKTYGDELWGYIELDQGGMANKIRTRQRLHDIGLNPMPVYHPLNDGWDYFDELATQYDRMCLGNVVQAHSAVRLRLLHTLWERHCQYPDLWVHVLGLSAGPYCLPCPPDSCDSSTWTSGFRWVVNSETAMLKALGAMGPEWHYTTSDSGREGHAIAYAEGMTHNNDIWNAVLRVHSELGAPMYATQNPLAARPA